MKKALIISAFILGGAVIMTGLALLNIWLWIGLSGVGLCLALLISVVLGIVPAIICKRLERTKGVSGTKMFWLLYALAAIAGVFFLIKGIMTPSGDLFSGRFLAGLGDFLFGISLLATDFVMMITTALVYAMTDNGTTDITEQEAPQNTPEQTENEKTEV